MVWFGARSGAWWDKTLHSVVHGVDKTLYPTLLFGDTVQWGFGGVSPACNLTATSTKLLVALTIMELQIMEVQILHNRFFTANFAPKILHCRLCTVHFAL